MAVRAHGTQFRIGDGGEPETFTTIAEVMDIEGFGSRFGVDHFYGDDDAFPTVVPANVESGEMAFDVNYSGDASQAPLHDAHNTQSVLSFQLVFPTDPVEVASFSGYVTGFEFAAPVAGILRARITITTASAVVLTTPE